MWQNFIHMLKLVAFYTPQEVCAVQSVKEANESINIGNEKNVIQVYKLVATCLSEHIRKYRKNILFTKQNCQNINGYNIW